MSDWKLTQQCFEVLRGHRQLLLVPFLGSLASILLTVVFLLPFALADWLNNEVWAVLTLFAYLFSQQFVSLFASSALLRMLVLRLQGDTPRLQDGFAFALSRLPQIFAWAGLSGVVGVVLDRIDRGSEQSRLRRTLHQLVGGAWSLVSYFAFPILVLEGLGPSAAMRKSLDLILDTWGHRRRAANAFSAVSLVAVCAGLFVLAAGLVLSQQLGSALWMWAGVIATSVYAVFATFFLICLGQVFRLALYLYATAHEARLPIATEFLEGAFE